MSTTSTLSTQPRTAKGTANSRRLRSTGQVPVSLYGGEGEALSLSLTTDELMPVVLAGVHVVNLDLAGEIEMAIIREVQWDTFMTYVLHMDLQRIDRNARIDVDVAIEIRGTLNEGTLDQQMHSLKLNCLAFDVPDKLTVRVGSMKIDDSVTVADLELPDGTTTEVPDDTLVLRVNAVVDIDIVQEDVSAAAEPEVIGAKSDDEDG